jgi:hypothetical protein
MTVCVPSIKVIFDSFFDNGRRMVMDNPFQLTNVSRAKEPQATTGSLVPIPMSYKFTAISRARNKADRNDGPSESVRNLTGGIITSMRKSMLTLTTLDLHQAHKVLRSFIGATGWGTRVC